MLEWVLDESIEQILKNVEVKIKNAPILTMNALFYFNPKNLQLF
jgi:hypothetical protein